MSENHAESRPSEPLVFDDLAPVEVPVSVRGRKYVLREASEGAAVTFRNAGMKAAKMVDGKVVGVEGAADVEPLLVSLCLSEADSEGRAQTLPNGEVDPRYRVSVNIVKSWPARVVKKLFLKAKEISDLGEEETAETLRKRVGEDAKKLRDMGQFCAVSFEPEEGRALGMWDEAPAGAADRLGNSRGGTTATST